MMIDTSHPRAAVSKAMRLAVAVLCSLAVTLPASAGIQGGTITFSSASTAAIPTMGSIGLLLLSALLAVIAFKSYRKAGSMTPAIVGLLGIAALASTGGSIHLVKEARANAPSANEVTGPGSEIFPAGANNFTNAAGSPLEVTGVDIETNCAVESNTTGNTECGLGILLEDGETCGIVVSCTVQDSDRRLKTDISQTGVASNGLPLYRFRYLDGKQYYEGVMAQDVLEYMPEAVLVGADGYYRVDYEPLGLRMRAVD